MIAQLQANAATAGRMLVELAKSLPETREPSPIDTVLDMAIVTPARSARSGTRWPGSTRSAGELLQA